MVSLGKRISHHQTQVQDIFIRAVSKNCLMVSLLSVNGSINHIHSPYHLFTVNLLPAEMKALCVTVLNAFILNVDPHPGRRRGRRYAASRLCDVAC